MYPSTSLFIAVGQLAIVILVLFSYPLQVHPCRSCIDKVLRPNHTDLHTTVATEDEDSENEVIDDHSDKELSTFNHTLLTTVIIASGFMIAYVIDDLRLGEFSTSRMSAAGNSGSNSAIVRWIDGVDNDFIYPTWAILLEGGNSNNELRYGC